MALEAMKSHAKEKHVADITGARRPPLTPSTENRKGWWERFWQEQPDRFGPPSMKVLKEIDTLLPVAHGIQAIDVGSGNGRYALEFLKRGMHTSALEWTKSGCALISSKVVRSEGALVVRNQDARFNGAIPANFDLVFSSGLIEEIQPEDHGAVIDNLIGAMAPSGILFLKFCIEVGGRGTLVDHKAVLGRLKEANLEILINHSDSSLRISQSDMLIRTASIACRRMERD